MAGQHYRVGRERGVHRTAAGLRVVTQLEQHPMGITPADAISDESDWRRRRRSYSHEVSRLKRSSVGPAKFPTQSAKPMALAVPAVKMASPMRPTERAQV